jgi:hypothetical protein
VTPEELRQKLYAYLGVSRDGWFVADRLVAADGLASAVEEYLQVLEKEKPDV